MCDSHGELFIAELLLGKHPLTLNPYIDTVVADDIDPPILVRATCWVEGEVTEIAALRTSLPTVTVG